MSTTEAINEFKAEMGREGLAMELQSKREWLETTIKSIAKLAKFRAVNDRHAQQIETLRREQETVKAMLEKRIEVIQKLLRSEGAISPVMIQAAKEYPIKRLLNTDKNVVKCVSHKDNHPSMSIKNNRAYCFACGYKGDAIDVYMTLNGCDFKSAVEALQ